MHRSIGVFVHSVLVLSLFVFSACLVPPIQPHLWKPDPSADVPASFTISKAFEFTDGKTRESFVVPAGTYTLWYQNKFGYYYRQEGTTIRRTNAKGEVDELVGGLGLGKRIDVISLYQLLTLAEDSNKHGELTHLAAWEQGDKDGFTRNWIVNLPRHFYPEIGFPEYQMPGTDR